MGDDAEKGQRARPNAGRRLSRPDGGAIPEAPVFHYDRGRRLEKAPESVRGLYEEGEPPRRPAFARAVPGGKIQLFTMLAILLVSVMALVVTVMGRDDSLDLAGNRVTVQAIRYDGLTIVSLGKTARTERRFLSLRAPRPPFAGPVYVEARPVWADADPGAGASFHSVVFTERRREFFSFSVPFDAGRVEIALRAGDAELRVEVEVEGAID